MPKIAQYKEKLLNEFESKTEEWTFGKFESRLCELRKNASYQDAKGIIIDAHNAGKWPKTVKRYLLTNYKAFDNVSSELTSVFNDVYSGMSSSEKTQWGLE
ncbi:hypothetical protein [Pseudoalteromonas sp.]|uniref:hypothetical protein n=1 Tax=Pseudoalteromonas sp. TaxID=53249 RepID=UPI002355A0D6|nr:hypothetical protein [Pseudoalteromonas sp.]